LLLEVAVVDLVICHGRVAVVVRAVIEPHRDLPFLVVLLLQLRLVAVVVAVVLMLRELTVQILFSLPSHHLVVVVVVHTIKLVHFLRAVQVVARLIKVEVLEVARRVKVTMAATTAAMIQVVAVVHLRLVKMLHQA
jgi:hypothetical protein